MKLDEILLIGGALVAALVLSKNGKLSSAYSLPQITNPVTNIITKVKSEPIQKTTTLLENILPTPITAPIPAPTPDPIILPTPTAINQDPLLNKYFLAKFPEWNDLLNPNINLARMGANIVNTQRALGSAAELRNIAADYFRNESV